MLEMASSRTLCYLGSSNTSQTDVQVSADLRGVFLLLQGGFRKAHQSEMKEMPTEDICAYTELCIS